jgi:hypothetical protein
VRVSVSAASAVCALTCLALSTVAGHAQVSATSAQFAPLPSVGFMPPYEIARTVRRSGFDPLAPPMREGSTYVVRATDFRGILMRIVVDARSGAIRDVSRIVPGPGSYGPQAGMAPGMGPNMGPGMGPNMAPYGVPSEEMPPPYGQPAEYDVPPASLEEGELSGRGSHAVTRASVTVPPLPRPRPPELAARKPIEEAKPESKPDAKAAAKTESKAAAKPESKTAAKPESKTAAKPESKPDAKPEVTGSAAPPVAAAPASAAPPASTASPATAAAKPARSLEPPPIND